ncbi:hypothetical protein UY3_05334 [Chelonia mydas]|uniref:Uncharacterized protein n=1 Tax=Chelonia mydas TaxID=8469 RepID=M7BHY7_CHEMY|nr:hypothetical protein UY3_05334 [Chelonia mydas]
MLQRESGKGISCTVTLVTLVEKEVAYSFLLTLPYQHSSVCCDSSAQAYLLGASQCSQLCKGPLPNPLRLQSEGGHIIASSFVGVFGVGAPTPRAQVLEQPSSGTHFIGLHKYLQSSYLKWKKVRSKGLCDAHSFKMAKIQSHRGRRDMVPATSRSGAAQGWGQSREAGRKPTLAQVHRAASLELLQPEEMRRFSPYGLPCDLWKTCQGIYRGGLGIYTEAQSPGSLSPVTEQLALEAMFPLVPCPRLEQNHFPRDFESMEGAFEGQHQCENELILHLERYGLV